MIFIILPPLFSLYSWGSKATGKISAFHWPNLLYEKPYILVFVTINKVVVFVGELFGKWLDYENGILMNGINAFIEENPEISPELSAL